MAHFTLGSLTASLRKRSLKTLLSLPRAAASREIDLPEENHIARPHLGEFFRAALLVMFWCSAPLGTAAQTLSSTSVAFGSWAVQNTSTTQAVKLTNTETVALNVRAVVCLETNGSLRSDCATRHSILGAQVAWNRDRR